MTARRQICVVAALLLLAGCVAPAAQNAQDVLTSLDKGVIEGDLGDLLDRSARRKAAEAEYAALESGQTGVPVKWAASDKVFGSVVPQQPYTVGASHCRRYVHTVSSNGIARTAIGTACRNENGSWQPLS